jgi:hypothetical protein
VAEYQAVIQALTWAVAQGLQGVAVFTDSQLVVKQVKGEYGCKAEHLAPLITEVRRLLRHLRGRIEWLERKNNHAADHQTRIALSEYLANVKQGDPHKGLDALLALWMCLRDYDALGRGLLPMGRPFWDALTIRYSLGCQKTIVRMLDRGEGLFWSRSNGFIALSGLYPVTISLIALAREKAPQAVTETQGTTSPAGRQVEVDRAALSANGKRGGTAKGSRRRAFYIAWVGVRGENGLTASQETLGKLWGVSERTIRAWDAEEGIETEANWVVADLSGAEHVPDHAREIETSAGPMLTYRSVLTRWAAAPTCRRGMAYRIEKRKRNRSRKPVANTDDGQTLGPLRLFFDDEKAMRRTRDRLASRAFRQGRDPAPKPAFVRQRGSPRDSQGRFIQRAGRTDRRQWRGSWWRLELA